MYLQSQGWALQRPQRTLLANQRSLFGSHQGIGPKRAPSIFELCLCFKKKKLQKRKKIQNVFVRKCSTGVQLSLNSHTNLQMLQKFCTSDHMIFSICDGWCRIYASFQLLVWFSLGLQFTDTRVYNYKFHCHRCLVVLFQ